MNFQTPIEDLWSHRGERRKFCSGIGFGLEGLIRRQHNCAPFDLSLTLPDCHPSTVQIEASRQFLRDQLVIPKSLGLPSDVKIISRRETHAYYVEEIEFTVTPPLRAPATVVIPKNGQKRHPSVIALHSMGGLRVFGREKLLAFPDEPAFLTEYRERNYSGRSLQEELAHRGYLSITIDAFNFGMRSAAASIDPARFSKDRLTFSSDESSAFSSHAGSTEEPAAVRGLSIAGLSIAALVATDDIRTVDYLCSRDDVDASRIGCGGLSFGSFRANYLSALDERIKAAVSVCWLSTLDGIIDYNVLGAMGFFALPPALFRRMDIADIVALSAPKPFLAISGWQDLLMQPCGIAEAHLRLREHWKTLSASTHFGSLIYEVGHEYNEIMQEASFDFFDHHLQRKSTRYSDLPLAGAYA